MFRYDDCTGSPNQVIFLDLQLSRESDPMSDIVYALYTGTTQEFRQQHLQSMLRLYFDKFTHICSSLSVPLLPGFSWEEFNRRFHRAKFFALTLALVFLPLVLKEPGAKGQKLHPSLIERLGGVLRELTIEGVL